ncbi:MAG: hypothetical protein LBR77_10800 [Lachnospiraceae bacterium]|nr:hypothetical protein [Lachnospiraceae bacterium]
MGSIVCSKVSQGHIIENKALSKDFYLMKVDLGVGAGAPIRPGRFFMLRSWGTEPVLSRPISVFDADGATVSFLYKVVGRGTKLFSGLKPGDAITCDGPHGNGFPDNPAGDAAGVSAHDGTAGESGGGTTGDCGGDTTGDAAGVSAHDGKAGESGGGTTGDCAWDTTGDCTGDCAGDTTAKHIGRTKIAMVGGGVGIAPFYLACKVYRGLYPDMRLDVYLGFSDEGILIKEYMDVADKVTVNVGGFVTDDVDAAQYDAILTCGPEIMMRVLYQKYLASGSGAQFHVSMENRMACGIGACLVCTCKNKSGNKKACKDGPVFPGHEVFGFA